MDFSEFFSYNILKMGCVHLRKYGTEVNMHLILKYAILLKKVHVIIQSFQNTTRNYMAVARGLGLPASRLAGRQTDAAPKHSLLFQ